MAIMPVATKFCNVYMDGKLIGQLCRSARRYYFDGMHGFSGVEITSRSRDDVIARLLDIVW